MTTLKKGDKVYDEDLNVKGTVVETPDVEYANELNMKIPNSTRQTPFYGKIVVRVKGTENEYYADKENLIPINDQSKEHSR